MKLTYLGTAAAEGFPALFCNCEYCNEARRLGGKNIRTRSQAIINDDLLLDFPSDTYKHFLDNSIEGDRIKYLLITHAHPDHFYKNDLLIRHTYFAHNMRVPTLRMICSETVNEMLLETPKNVEVTVISPFETVELDGYRITALPARHMKGTVALFYIIEGEKTVLYAHDTGYFYDEVFDFIKEKKTVFDFVSLDCTNVDIPIPDTGSHMGFSNINRVVEKLRSFSAVDNDTVICINHFSHNGNPLHDHLCERASEYGYLVSYDGFEVEF